MPDPRVQKLARVIVNYSLKIKKGDKFRIAAAHVSQPLVREVFREAVRAGAYVNLQPLTDDLSEIFLEEASEEQLTHVSEYSRFVNDYFDAYLHIWGDENTKSLSHIDPKRLALAQQSGASLFQRMLERLASGELRWCGTLFPAQANAQDAGMSQSQYEDFVYSAGLLDLDDPVAGWQKVHADQQRIADFLGKHDEIHIVADGTDITYHVGGRTWINCAGTENFPDGEVFTGPIEDSVNGVVRFTYPAVHAGNEVEDVRLTFRDGKVVESGAARGLDYLDSMLDMDAGSRTLGEAAFGLNYNITRFSRNTLFDEKIGGTMHLALGASLPESGGVNKSGLHWDLVSDLHNGKVFADGQLCYENGKFLI